MKDKEIQRELWREDKAVNSLENVLRILWAGEATHQQQSALSNQAVAGVHPGKKCFECSKAGHLQANCPTGSKPNPARSDQCNFSVEWTRSKYRKTAMESKPTQGAKTVDERVTWPTPSASTEWSGVALGTQSFSTELSLTSLSR